MISEGAFAGDWEFQLRFWLPQMVDICLKLYGYKSDIAERRWLLAGCGEGAPLVAAIDERNNVTMEKK